MLMTLCVFYLLTYILFFFFFLHYGSCHWCQHFFFIQSIWHFLNDWKILSLSIYIYVYIYFLHSYIFLGTNSSSSSLSIIFILLQFLCCFESNSPLFCFAFFILLLRKFDVCEIHREVFIKPTLQTITVCISLLCFCVCVCVCVFFFFF